MVIAIKIAVTAVSAFTFVWFNWLMWHPSPASVVAELARPAAAICKPPNVAMGMTKAALLAECGPPSSVFHQIVGGGASDSEQWSYDRDGVYVYLSKGVVDGLQYAEGNERFKWQN